MNQLGIIFISISWVFILGLGVFSFAKMFSGKKKNKKKKIRK
jgi:hypothetical protein